jgi:hypothetical protein
MSPKTPELATIIETAVRNRLAEVHVMLPGRVEKYDARSQKVNVQPLIKRFQEGADSETIEETYPVISGVPLAFPRVGKFAITFPVKPGDLVTLNFCESSIETYQLGGGRKPVSPDLFQRFDLSDAVATPGWYPDGKALQATDLKNIVIGEDGLTSQFVALANLVLQELEAARDDRAAMKSTFDSHIHVTTATVSAGPVGVIADPAGKFPTPTDPNSVAAETVKVT